MDTLLAGGDHSTDARGLPRRITGTQELIQRALIRLQVKKGSFALDPSLGSELHKLRRSGSETNNRLAMGYVQEALAPLQGVSVESVRCSLSGSEDLLVTVELLARGESVLLEVTA